MVRIGVPVAAVLQLLCKEKKWEGPGFWTEDRPMDIDTWIYIGKLKASHEAERRIKIIPNKKQEGS